MLLAMMAADVQAIPSNKEEVEFECDTPGGHFSYWSRKMQTPTARIEGEIKIKDLRRTEKWLPVANIFLLDASDKTVAGIGLTQDPQASQHFYIVARIPPNGGKKLIGGFDVSEASIPLALGYDGSELQIEVGSQSWRIDFKSSIAEKIQLSCSSGDFRFQNMVITEKF